MNTPKRKALVSREIKVDGQMVGHLFVHRDGHISMSVFRKGADMGIAVFADNPGEFEILHGEDDPSFGVTNWRWGEE